MHPLGHPGEVGHGKTGTARAYLYNENLTKQGIKDKAKPAEEKYATSTDKQGKKCVKGTIQCILTERIAYWRD